MSEESTEQSNVSPSLEEEDDYSPHPRQHPLPWVLFGVAVVMLAIIGGLLAKRLGSETRRANEEIEKSAGLKAQIEQLVKQQGEVDKRIADADAKVKAAEAASVDAAAKLKKAESERDKLQKELEAMGKKGGKADESSKKGAKKGKKKPKRR